MELLLRCQLGVLNWKRVLPSRSRTECPVSSDVVPGLAVVTEAFSVACSFKHDAIALLLLDRAIALDPDLGAHVDASVERLTFVKYFIDNGPQHATEVGFWKAFVMEQVGRAVSSHSGHETSVASPSGDSDLTAFLRLLHREPWLLGEAFVQFQAGIIERATLKNRGDFITALPKLSNPPIAHIQCCPRQRFTRRLRLAEALEYLGVPSPAANSEVSG